MTLGVQVDIGTRIVVERQGNNCSFLHLQEEEEEVVEESSEVPISLTLLHLQVRVPRRLKSIKITHL